MPNAIQIGRKKSRISPELAARMAEGAVVAGAPTVEELEAAAQTPNDPDKNKPGEGEGDQLNAGEGEGAGAGEGEGEGGESNGAGEGEQPNADLTAKVTTLEGNIATLNTQLTTQKGINEHLQTQLNAANETLGTTKAELATAKEAVEKSAASITSLRAVAMTAIKNLSVAFSTQPPVLEGMSDEALCKTYTDMRTRFDKAYVTGGRSKASDEGGNPPPNLLEGADVHPAASAATRVTSLPSRAKR
jgi:hypothetical protein